MAARRAVFWHRLPKMALFGAKISFFLRYAHITHIFGLRRTRINGIITSPYPEVTLGTFGFPVYARLAARWAVFWPQLPKMALFGAILMLVGFAAQAGALWSTLVVQNGYRKSRLRFLTQFGAVGGCPQFWPRSAQKGLNGPIMGKI